MGGTGLIFQKAVALYAECNERAEAAISSYPATGGILQYIYFVLVAQNPIKAFSLWFFLCRHLLTILIMVTEQQY